MTTVMITGGSGTIATALRSSLTEYSLRLTDMRDLPEPTRSNETFVKASLSDRATLTEVAKGADLVIHLGAVLTDRDFPDTADANIMGTYSVLEAARAAGVARFFFASSNHAVGYTPVATLGSDSPPARMEIRPDGYYGASKAAAEALCSLFVDTHGMMIVSARILSFAQEPRSLRELATWISPADMARLVVTPLNLTDPAHHIIWGVSRNTRGWADLSDGEAIGFSPEDDSESFAERFVPHGTEADRRQLVTIGGRLAPHERTSGTVRAPR